MNERILIAQGWLMDSENYTKEQLKENYIAAATDDVNDNIKYGNYIAGAIVHACSATVNYYLSETISHSYSKYCVEHYAIEAVKYWLSEYFDLTGENRQDYIDLINRGK